MIKTQRSLVAGLVTSAEDKTGRLSTPVSCSSLRPNVCSHCNSFINSAWSTIITKDFDNNMPSAEVVQSVREKLTE